MYVYVRNEQWDGMYVCMYVCVYVCISGCGDTCNYLYIGLGGCFCCFAHVGETHGGNKQHVCLRRRWRVLLYISAFICARIFFLFFFLLQTPSLSL